jgi:RimJ/RimL family protein N-acetyltransferase
MLHPRNSTPNPVAPTLETERLRLRGHRLSDFEAMAALWGDPNVVRFISGKPSTREQSWARLLRNVGHWKVFGFGCWVIEAKSDGRFIGEVGLGNFQRDLPISMQQERGSRFLRTRPRAGSALCPRALEVGADLVRQHDPHQCVVAQG